MNSPLVSGSRPESQCVGWHRIKIPEMDPEIQVDDQQFEKIHMALTVHQKMDVLRYGEHIKV